MLEWGKMTKMRKMTKRPEAKTDKLADEKAVILGVGVSSTPGDEVLRKIIGICRKKDFTKTFFIVTANVEILMLAQNDENYRKVLNSADLVTPDSVGVVWASDGKIKKRIAGRKITEALLGEPGLKYFFLGGRNGVAKKMAEKYGGEWDQGHEDIENQIKDPQINDRIIKKVNNFLPDVLFVVYGSPWESLWIWEHRNELKAKVAMGVGGTFDYLTGQTELPPVWAEKAGLEWLWRLVRQPVRWRRQLKLIEFVWKVILFQ